jgi:hypothetical protein
MATATKAKNLEIETGQALTKMVIGFEIKQRHSTLQLVRSLQQSFPSVALYFSSRKTSHQECLKYVDSRRKYV